MQAHVCVAEGSGGYVEQEKRCLLPWDPEEKGKLFTNKRGTVLLMLFLWRMEERGVVKVQTRSLGFLDEVGGEAMCWAERGQGLDGRVKVWQEHQAEWGRRHHPGPWWSALELAWWEKREKTGGPCRLGENGRARNSVVYGILVVATRVRK